MLVGSVAPVAAQSPSAVASPGPAATPTCTALGAAPVARSDPSPAASGAPVIATGELTVFAAASLKSAFEAFAPSVAATSGLAPVFSFDASPALRAQIEEGAPADVFASADVANVQALLDAGLARHPVAFACNELAIIVPAGNPAAVASAADLGRAGVAVIAAGPEVPITRYATQLAANLGITDAYAANVVSEEDNVAAVRARIEAGEGDAAVVYVTDALLSGDLVERIAVPADANVSATYAAAAIVESDQPAEALAFLDLLTGPGGQAALASFGFLPVSPASS
jgi:molybdate transport system substrate-binding protein